MKVCILNHSDIRGGAARAAYRIHQALRASGIDSEMFVEQAYAGDFTVKAKSSKLAKLVSAFRAQLEFLITESLRSPNQIHHSLSVLPSRWPRLLNESDVDLVHLHWINGGMLSAGDIGRIKKPLVWTLHDMWAFCGAEHYSDDFIWRNGYNHSKHSSKRLGFDLNRWFWKYKKRHWQNPFQIVTPSNWLFDCVRESALLSGFPVSVVPNAIDTQFWRPIDKALARELLGLPLDKPLLLFGAMGGGQDPRKGFDLLKSALNMLRGELLGLQLLVFGELSPKKVPDLGFQVHYTGHLHDDLTLMLHYSAADALVIPSRQDNLPNTGVESLACGTPVVAFDTCGLPDIVDHLRTGFLAKAFDIEQLAEGIKWVVSNPDTQLICANSRSKAVRCFDSKVVAKKYVDIYQEVMNR